MKRILFLIHDLGHGGAEKVLVNLVNNMDKNKFDITVMALFGGGVNEQFLSPNVKLINCFKKPIHGNSYLMKLFSPKLLHKLLIREDYDIEIAYLEGPSARIIGGCNNKKTRLISWIHSEHHDKKRAAKSYRSFSEFYRCYQQFDKIICVSETVKNDFYSIYHIDNKMEVLYNTIESEKIVRLSHEQIKEDIFDNQEFNIVGVGKILKNKGFDRMARILKRLREDGYPIHWFALGIGEEQEHIEKFLQEYDLQDYFTFLGYQTNPYKYVAKCDLFVCASFAEGFSTATTEALIVGTPVCTVEVSGMKEMLGNNNEFGIITKNTEEDLYFGIKKLIENRNLLEYYKKKAKERGKSFSAEKTTKAVEAMLQEISK